MTYYVAVLVQVELNYSTHLVFYNTRNTLSTSTVLGVGGTVDARVAPCFPPKVAPSLTTDNESHRNWHPL
jgi:hypothetical protein